MEESGYVRELQAEETHDARARLENLQELVGVAREYEANDAEPTLAGFLSNVSLISDLDTLDDDASYVTLMTMHGARVSSSTASSSPAWKKASSRTAARSPMRRTRRRAPSRLRRGYARDGAACSSRYAPRRALYGNTFAYPKSRFLEEIPGSEFLESR